MTHITCARGVFVRENAASISNSPVLLVLVIACTKDSLEILFIIFHCILGVLTSRYEVETLQRPREMLRR